MLRLMGQSPFPFTNSVVAALQRQAEKDYLPVQGCAKLWPISRPPRWCNGKVWGDVMVGPGSKELLFFSLLDAELADPVGFCAASGSGGRTVGGWTPDWRTGGSQPDCLEHACLAGQGPRILLLVALQSAGAHDRQALEALATVCRAHQVLVVRFMGRSASRGPCFNAFSVPRGNHH